MHILYIGLTYKKTPVSLREKLSFSAEELALANQQLNETKSVLENVILSTCNRTEIYCVVDQLHTGQYYVKHFLADFFQIDFSEIASYLEFKEDMNAVSHCFSVACGIDSMVIGETQILGQLKRSFFIAQQLGATGTIFNHLFNEVIAFSKRIHTQYGLNEHSVSLSHSALKLADANGGTEGKHLFIVGTGEMAQLVLKNTANFSFKQVTVFNRTLSSARELVSKYSPDFKVKPLEQLKDSLAKADVLITAITVHQPIIKSSDFQSQINVDDKELLMIDLGSPRNIAVECGDLENVALMDLDDIYSYVKENQVERESIKNQVLPEIEEAVNKFDEWEKQLGIIPVIKKIREQTLAIEEMAMKSLLQKLPLLDDRETKIIRKHMKSIVNQVLRTPIKEIKELSIQKDSASDICLIQKIFGVDVEKGEGHENH